MSDGFWTPQLIYGRLLPLAAQDDSFRAAGHIGGMVAPVNLDNWGNAIVRLALGGDSTTAPAEFPHIAALVSPQADGQSVIPVAGFSLAWNADAGNWQYLPLVDEPGVADDVSQHAMPVTASMRAFNGINYDRWRNNITATVFPPQVRNGTTFTSPILTNHNHRGVHLVLNITSVPGVQLVTFFSEGFDAASGQWYPILTSAPLATTGTTVQRIYPGLTPVANLVANDVLPRTWRVRAVHSGAGNFNYSVGAALIL